MHSGNSLTVGNFGTPGKDAKRWRIYCWTLACLKEVSSQLVGSVSSYLLPGSSSERNKRLTLTPNPVPSQCQHPSNLWKKEKKKNTVSSLFTEGWPWWFVNLFMGLYCCHCYNTACSTQFSNWLTTTCISLLLFNGCKFYLLSKMVRLPRQGLCSLSYIPG